MNVNNEGIYYSIRKGMSIIAEKIRRNETVSIKCGVEFHGEEWKHRKEGRGVYTDRD